MIDKITTARALVDECAKHPDNKNMVDVGMRIGKELNEQYPGDDKMLGYALEYMTEKAVHQGCGPNADHDCPWKNTVHNEK